MISVPWHQILWEATWGNNMAAVEWGMVMAVPGFLLRHHIGRRVAAWWDRHHGPLAEQRHLNALRRHEEGK